MPFLQMRIFPAPKFSCSWLHHFQLLIRGPQNWKKTWNKYTNIHLLNPFCWGLCSKAQHTKFSSAKPARKHMQASHLETGWETENQIRNRFIQRMWEIYLGSWWGSHDWLVAWSRQDFPFEGFYKSSPNATQLLTISSTTSQEDHCAESTRANICKHGYPSTEMKHLSKQKTLGKSSTWFLLWRPWTISQILIFSPLIPDPQSHLPNRSSTGDSSPSQCLSHSLYFVH